MIAQHYFSLSVKVSAVIAKQILGAFLLTPSYDLGLDKAAGICDKLNFRGSFSLTKTATGILFKFSEPEDYQQVFRKGFHKVFITQVRNGSCGWQNRPFSQIFQNPVLPNAIRCIESIKTTKSLQNVLK